MAQSSIYTFRSEFLKIHQRTTPKRMMADALKNNLLEGHQHYHFSKVLVILKNMGEVKKVIWRPKIIPKEKTASFG